MTPTEFLRAIDGPALSMVQRALALLWWVGRHEPSESLSTGEVCSAIEAAGHATQNRTRLAAALAAHRDAVKAGAGRWRLHPRGRAELTAKYNHVDERRQPAAATDSVLPRELFATTRGYIEKVVYQINASYDSTLYDCSAVMCRRLLETLIIEVYEHGERAAAIKGVDGQFFMFAGLLSVLENDSSINLGRNALKGLRDFKTLGDLSAHNRRYNARKDDIDRVRDGLRVAAEELLHLAALT
jgi:hypothetical protein